MNSNTNNSGAFTSTHFMIYLITTLLLLMGIIYWVSGCRMMDHSNNAGKAKTETVKHEGGHH